jgi:hypothetical protein
MFALLLALATPGQYDPEVIKEKVAEASEAQRQHDICLFGFAKKFGKTSRETADTIAEGAFGNCSATEQRYRAAMFNMPGGLNNSQVEQLMSTFRTARRRMLIAEIIKSRGPS